MVGRSTEQFIEKCRCTRGISESDVATGGAEHRAGRVWPRTRNQEMFERFGILTSRVGQIPGEMPQPRVVRIQDESRRGTFRGFQQRPSKSISLA